MMRRLLYLAVGCILLAAGAAAADFMDLAEDARIPRPDGWSPGADSSGYPYQLVHTDPAAELLIHRTVIDQDESLHSEQELQESVEYIVDDVILDLPEARLLTSTGYYDHNRTGFVIEFLSADPSSGVDIRHRFVGIIYRHSDGHQLMFTLWGKAAATDYEQVAASIDLMQSEFAYTGPALDEVFSPKGFNIWYLGLIPVFLIGLLGILRRRPKSSVPKPRREAVKV